MRSRACRRRSRVGGDGVRSVLNVRSVLLGNMRLQSGGDLVGALQRGLYCVEALPPHLGFDFGLPVRLPRHSAPWSGRIRTGSARRAARSPPLWTPHEFLDAGFSFRLWMVWLAVNQARKKRPRSDSGSSDVPDDAAGRRLATSEPPGGGLRERVQLGPGHDRGYCLPTRPGRPEPRSASQRHAAGQRLGGAGLPVGGTGRPP